MLLCLNAAISETDTVVKVDKTGLYVIYSSVNWHSCVSSWHHRVYVNDALMTNSSWSSYSNTECRNNSHVVAVSFLNDNDTVRVKASDETDAYRRTEFRTVLRRVG